MNAVFYLVATIITTSGGIFQFQQGTFESVEHCKAAQAMVRFAEPEGQGQIKKITTDCFKKERA